MFVYVVNFNKVVYVLTTKLLSLVLSVAMFVKIGATFGRGLNRVLATFLAAALGFGVHFLADLAGDKAQPIMLSLSVFFLGMQFQF